jgi:hypothetical protein
VVAQGSGLIAKVNTSLLAALAVVGVLVTGFSTQRAAQVARERDELAVTSAAAQVAAMLDTTLTGLTGIDGLAIDGAVSEAEFSAFARDVLTDSILSALALADIVPGAEREAWESATGYTMIDTDGVGGFTPAEARDEHVVVRAVYPVTEASRSVLGFDFASDPVRSRGVDEALRSDTPVLVGPIRLARAAAPGLFAVHEVRDADGRPVGVMASGVSIEPMTDGIRFPAGVRGRPVSVLVDGDPVTTVAGRGASVTFTSGGRTFTVQTEDGRGVSWPVPAATAVGTLALLGAALASRRRDVSERARESRIRARSVALTSLADALAGADTVDEATRAGLDHARAVMGSSYVNLGLVDSGDAHTVTVVHDTSMPVEMQRRFASQDLDDPLPLTECIRTGRTVVVASPGEFADRYPAVLRDVTSAGIGAVICCPLTVGRTAPIGAVGFAWRDALDARDVDELAQAAAATAQIIGRALERSVSRDTARERAEQLSAFASSLAAAQSPDDVVASARERLPILFGVPDVDIGAANGGALFAREYPLPSDPSDASLRFGRGVEAWGDEDDAMARTVTQLVDAAWSRARQHHQEHAVVQRLQTTMLTGAPTIDGLDVAVAYQSALDTIEIGGDWYSVIERPDATYLVIGDTVGHGPAAVAVMAEVKTIIRHLLSSGAPMDEVMHHADSCLARREAFASAVVVCIDRDAHRISYINAGHPYPIVRQRGGSSVVLARTHRPWLGMVGYHTHAATHEFAPGDTIVLYTDGLVEQRGVPVTDSIAELAGRIECLADRTAEAIIDELLAHRRTHADARTVDDDIAVIAVTRTS